MSTIVGDWRLVGETVIDAAGQALPPFYGPEPLGFASFTPAGRMIVALSDGRSGPVDGPRSYLSYCGAYTFDGTQLVTLVDGASVPQFMESPQIRNARFEGDRLILRIAGSREIKGVVRELIWRRIP
jgi:hypothetical protein